MTRVRPILVIALLAAAYLVWAPASIPKKGLEYSFESGFIYAADPPPSGLWVISNTTVVLHQTILLNGSIVVQYGGNLTLVGCEVIINSGSDYAFNIYVQEGGNLTLVDTQIYPYQGYLWFLETSEGSNLNVRSCDLDKCGGSFEGSLVSILNSSLSDSGDRGIWACGVGNLTLVGNLIENASSDGVAILECIGSVVSSNTIQDSGEEGIDVNSCSDCVIVDNTIIRTRRAGVLISSSDNCTLSRNVVLNPGGLAVELSLDSPDEPVFYESNDNQIDSLPIVILQNSAGSHIDGGAGEVILINSTDVVIEHLVGNGVGVYFSDSTVVADCALQNGTINVRDSPRTWILRNEVTTHYWSGVPVIDSPDSVIEDNRISSDATTSLRVERSEDSRVVGNELSGYSSDCIYINHSPNCTVSGNRVESARSCGIYFDFSPDSMAMNNSVFNTRTGIYTRYSGNSSVVDNDVSGSGSGGYYTWGNTLEDVIFRSFSGNTLDGYPTLLLQNSAEQTVGEGLGHLFVINCSDVVVRGLCGRAIYVWFSNATTVEGCVVFGGGIYAQYSQHTVISQCVCSDSVFYAIYLRGCSDSSLLDNAISASEMYGIRIDSTNTTSVVGNSIVGSLDYDLYLLQSHDIVFYLNELSLEDRIPVSLSSCTSLVWHNGTHGNYWHNWTGVDAGADGIGDTPYVINVGNQDPYPLTDSTIILARRGVVDTTGPTIALHHYPPSPLEANDVLVISEIGDISGVEVALLSYRLNTSGSWNNLTMTEADSVWTAFVPKQVEGTDVDYRVSASDSLGNWATSVIESYTVLRHDMEGPEILVAISPLIPYDNSSVTVSAVITDESGVEQAILSCSIDEQATWVNSTMILIEGAWTGHLSQYDGGTRVFYRVYSEDGAGNWASTDPQLYVVLLSDTEGPQIGASHFPLVPLVGYAVTVNATVSDTSGVEQVVLSYTTDGMTWMNASMIQQESFWVGAIPGQSSGTEVSYRVYAEDARGNWAVTLVQSYVVESSVTTTATSTEASTETETISSSGTGTNGFGQSAALSIEFAIAVLVGILVIAFVMKRR
jgi:parallel beta-helix repeat protein